MKNTYLYLLVLLLICSCTDSLEELVESSVSDATTRSSLYEKDVYYWFKGEKMPLKEVGNKSFIIIKQADKESVASFFSKLDKELCISDDKRLIRDENLIYDDIVDNYKDLLWTDIKTSVKTAYSNPNVFYAAPFYRNPNDGSEFPLTNMLYVFLKDKTDLPTLKKKTTELE